MGRYLELKRKLLEAKDQMDLNPLQSVIVEILLVLLEDKINEQT